MRRTLIAVLAASVALPMMAASAHAQQDRYGYTPSDDYPYHWGEARRGVDRGPDAGEYPEPPRTPDRYITDWDDPRARRAYLEGYEHGRYGSPARADDRWSERQPPRRDFDRPSPPPGYDEQAGSGGEWYGHGPDARHGHRRDHMRGERYREMHARHHGGGHRDLDFRRDFRQDGRRGYYQDSSYEDMPRGHRMRGDRRGEMGRMRRGLRMIEQFDTDGDGRVTQAEVDRYRADRLEEFDTDDDGRLTLEEYEALWLDAMRERMVRRFQRHDRDGDGWVTVDEFSEATGDLVLMRDRDRDGSISERDFMRPTVEAPMGGLPNEPAESRVPRDDDPEVGTRPEVEAPLGGEPNEPAGPAADEGESNDN